MRSISHIIDEEDRAISDAARLESSEPDGAKIINKRGKFPSNPECLAHRT